VLAAIDDVVVATILLENFSRCVLRVLSKYLQIEAC